jgi:hypothetical protein
MRMRRVGSDVCVMFARRGLSAAGGAEVFVAVGLIDGVSGRLKIVVAECDVRAQRPSIWCRLCGFTVG